MWRTGAGTVLVVLTLAGCGGDDEPSTAGSEPVTNAATAAPSPQETATGDAEGFCAEVEEIRERVENLETLPEVDDPESAAQAIEDSVDALRSVDPPDEIATDWKTVTDAFDSVVTDLRALDTSDPEVLVDQLEQLGARMEQQSAAIEEAGSRIDEYLAAECGISFD